jgi:hypothetical protein
MGASATEHTRLHCGDCGLMQFSLWIDTAPPETCPLGKKPRKCPEVRTVIINGNGFAKLMGEPVSGVVRALQQRLGYTEQEIAEMMKRHEEDGALR